MTMLKKMIVSFALAGLLLPGCSSLLFKSTPAPLYFQLDYPPVTVECPQGFKKGVKILEFSVSSPYDQTNMVVIEKGQRVSYSSSYQWVTSPGRLIADSLLRDLNAGRLFPQAAASNSPVMTPLEMTGHVFNFSWEKMNSEYRARLHIELSLTDTTGTSAERSVVMRKNYQLTSEPYRENSPDNFAKAMGSAMAQFSKELQGDLCRQAGAAPSDSSS